MRKYRKRPVVVEAMLITEEVFEAKHPSELHTAWQGSSRRPRKYWPRGG